MNSIFSRVSVRKYLNKQVEKEKTEAILRAAMQAPSAANQQPWEFYVVTNREKLRALARTSPYAGMTKDAPAAIVSVYRKDCAIPAYADIDMSIAMENMWLETDAQGLGGVWLGIAPHRRKDEGGGGGAGHPRSSAGLCHLSLRLPRRKAKAAGPVRREPDSFH